MILYVSMVDSSVKSGLYNAVKYRVIGLKKSNNKVYSINFNRTNASISWVDSNKFLPKVLNSKLPFRYLTEIMMFVTLYQLIKKKKPLVIHVHWAYPIGYVCVMLGLLLGIKVILTVHGSDIHTHPLKNKYIYNRTRFALKNASKVFFVGDALLSEAKEIFSLNSDSFHVSYNFYHEDILKFRSKYIGNDRVLNVSYIGNFNQVKGVDRIYEIMKEVIKKIDIPINLSLAGDGPLRDRVIRDLSGLNLNLYILGHISRESVYRLINRSDVLIMPSYKEGFGILALESFLLETPCVSFQIDGLESVYKYNKQLQAKSSKDFANAIIWCKENAPVDVNSKEYEDYFSLNRILNNEIESYYV
ncbi:glycosyltransferase [Vibrio fluvialis]|uniref:glycosyltransferase n=1 Tax=Vibrio fluvialis TaxID=676 RepID=UPI0024DFA8CF|nr:glycosyltransferase [Vibrio fluvialis]WIE03924.1 glycosyltransferase [Vibrio fluvialis]